MSLWSFCQREDKKLGLELKTETTHDCDSSAIMAMASKKSSSSLQLLSHPDPEFFFFITNQELGFQA